MHTAMPLKKPAEVVKSIELILGASRGPHMNYDPHLGFATDDAKHPDLDLVRELLKRIADESISDAELVRQITEACPWLKDKAEKLAGLRKNPKAR
jgi:hypothetical protein